MNFETSSLNAEQLRAVQAEGPVLIEAGPGTGKTHTLVSRILYLVTQKNVDPRKILALTFTKKAAQEMKDRLKKQNLSVLPYIYTFHSLALDFLSQYKDNLEIISEAEQKELLRDIVEKHGKKIGNRELKGLILSISKYKNSLNSPAYKKENTDIFHQYNQMLAERRQMDYDDLLINFYHQLQNKKTVSGPRFDYIHVDEFQDTNGLQYEIVKKLVRRDFSPSVEMTFTQSDVTVDDSGHQHIFVIGDPHQSIYGFRGANPKIFNLFKTDFPTVTTITLKKNYRSSPQVINASSSLFSQGSCVVPVQNAVGEVQLITTLNEQTEAEWIISKIDQLVGGTDLLKAGETVSSSNHENCDFADFAVIYRTHSHSRVLEQKFIDSGIPFQVIGGNSIYEQTEIAFIITALKYLVQPKEESLEQLFISPIIGMGRQSRLIIKKTIQEQRLSLDEIVLYLQQHSLLAPREHTKLAQLYTSLQQIMNKCMQIPLQECIEFIVKEFEIDKRIAGKKRKEQLLKQFQNVMLQFEKKGITSAVAYLEYLEEHEFYDIRADKVTLMTMHAAKGLEFRHVFICGFEEGIIPHVNAEDIGEEKRLLYVALSRAKSSVYLLLSKERYRKKKNISRFYEVLSQTAIQEMEDEALERYKKRIKKQQDKKSQMKLF